ncbi:MAG: hypothetical protein ACXABI_10865 [Candidatus Hodarchaeales archaeon]
MISFHFPSTGCSDTGAFENAYYDVTVTLDYEQYPQKEDNLNLTWFLDW